MLLLRRKLTPKYSHVYLRTSTHKPSYRNAHSHPPQRTDMSMQRLVSVLRSTPALSVMSALNSSYDVRRYQSYVKDLSYGWFNDHRASQKYLKYSVPRQPLDSVWTPVHRLLAVIIPTPRYALPRACRRRTSTSYQAPRHPQKLSLPRTPSLPRSADPRFLVFLVFRIQESKKHDLCCGLRQEAAPRKSRTRTRSSGRPSVPVPAQCSPDSPGRAHTATHGHTVTLIVMQTLHC